MSEVASISRYGRTEPFGLQVSRGQVAWHSVVHVFGYNPDVDLAAEETVWTAGGLLSHPESATVMKVSSTSASDTSDGTGARTVYILGVNGTGGYASETVTLNGQTAVNTVHAYFSIERVSALTVGSGGVNAGDINIGVGVVTAGVPETIYGQIATGENNSLMGHWTCPTGYTGYMVFGSISSGTEAGSSYLTGRLKLRGTDDIVRTAAIVTFSNGAADFNFAYPIKISAGECVTATVKTTANNEAASSYFQILLVKNSGE
jgi:hypothetical protein